MGTLETGSRGKPGMKCHCPLFSWLQVSWGPLDSLGDVSCRGGSGGKEKAQVCSQEREQLGLGLLI